MTKIQALSTAIVAYNNCIASDNTEWQDRWDARIKAIERSLPHGSGLDGEVSVSRMTGRVIAIFVDYHHMNDDGFYIGWSHHMITVSPTFAGVDVDIDPELVNPGIEIDDRDCLYDYLSELFHANLSEPWSFE